ncbi:MAG: peptide chain release factor N(5)-glutamine methyltransferase [Mediterranea sp.]|nr:peptide chain release factor N(5)-glutamine methyltransferase [Mediterranea sp.]
MNPIAAHIRTVLCSCYTPQEAAALTRLLCCEVFGQRATDYYLGKDMLLSSNDKEELERILARLCRFEPIQYILGAARFVGRTFRVAPGVLIPRPETEELVEWMLQQIPADACILDIGTGSGCIAITLAKELPRAQVEAWDISDAALEIARSNGIALQADVRFVRHDVWDSVSPSDGCYDVLVSNPPYVLEREKAAMERNVLDWEPSSALFVPDDDPLRFYRRIGQLGHTLLRGGGRLYFEINRAFGQAAVAMLQAQGYADVAVRKDMSGNDRFIIAIR